MIVIIRLVIEMNNDGDDNSDGDNDDDDDDECNQCLLKLSHGGTAMSDDK